MPILRSLYIKYQYESRKNQNRQLHIRHGSKSLPPISALSCVRQCVIEWWLVKPVITEQWQWALRIKHVL